MLSFLYLGGPEAAIALSPVFHEFIMGIVWRVVLRAAALLPQMEVLTLHVGVQTGIAAFFILVQMSAPYIISVVPFFLVSPYENRSATWIS